MNNQENNKQYLVFKLDDIKYAIEITLVQEVIQWIEPTPLPSSSSFCRGIINLRGRTIPVIDLSRRLSIEKDEQADSSVIIVLSFIDHGNDKLIGFDVDAVSEVRRIDSADIQSTDEMMQSEDVTNVEGVYMDGDETLVVIKALDLIASDDVSYPNAA